MLNIYIIVMCLLGLALCVRRVCVCCAPRDGKEDARDVMRKRGGVVQGNGFIDVIDLI